MTPLNSSAATPTPTGISVCIESMLVLLQLDLLFCLATAWPTTSARRGHHVVVYDTFFPLGFLTVIVGTWRCRGRMQLLREGAML